MKKIFLFIALSLLAFYCSNEPQLQDSVYKRDIDDYFTVLKKTDASIAPSIDQLHAKIDFKRVTTLNLRTTEKLIIADLKESLEGFEKSEKVKVIFYLNHNRIVRSNILTFKDKHGGYDHNILLHSVLNQNGANNSYSGKISFYSIVERQILFFNEFENGFLRANGKVQTKGKIKEGGRTADVCIDWYLVTTYHFGSYSYTVSDFVYSSCRSKGCDTEVTRMGRVGGCGDGGGTTSGSGAFPANPHNGDDYYETDASGRYTHYRFNSITNIWQVVQVIMPAVEVNGYTLPSFLSSISNPYNNQIVLGSDGFVYHYEEAGGNWVGEDLDSNLSTLVGNKPIAEYDNKCTGLQNMWNNFPSNEVYGYITTDGKLLVTNVLPANGGTAFGPYTYNGTTYYPYPVSQGSPSGSYSGMIQTAGFYLIPVIASVHTHSPCRNDGTNGVSHSVGNDDIAFATNFPSINHWVIGCNAIAQYNSTSSNFFNVKSGNISSNCSSVQ